VIAGDIGAVHLEPDLRRVSADADSDVARAAHDELRLLAAQQRQDSTQGG